MAPFSHPLNLGFTEVQGRPILGKQAFALLLAQAGMID
jgi:hypothetical protein